MRHGSLLLVVWSRFRRYRSWAGWMDTPGEMHAHIVFMLDWDAEVRCKILGRDASDKRGHT